MILVIVRHGDALPADGSPGGDPTRPLSEQGETDIQALGLILSHVSPPVSRILTSPLLRAKQTGLILARTINPPLHAEQTDLLTPGFRHKPLLDSLGSDKEGTVIAVGHEPDCSGLVSHLVAGQTIHMRMRPGTAAAVQTSRTDSQDGRLLWVLTPELVRQMTESHQRRNA
ncbi:MAG: histidine phosphatase family protein [Ignavibacteria bacterium]|nr:histidine phosphatase family protein [Ignavibacteria bacterium]